MVLARSIKFLRRFGAVAILLLAAAVPLLWPAGVWPRKLQVIPPGKEGLAVVSQIWKKAADNNLIFVQGTVTNHADRPLYSVKVEVELVNKAGTVLGTTIDQTQVIEPHKTWGFKALVIDPEATTALPAKVTWLR